MLGVRPLLAAEVGRLVREQVERQRVPVPREEAPRVERLRASELVERVLVDEARDVAA